MKNKKIINSEIISYLSSLKTNEWIKLIQDILLFNPLDPPLKNTFETQEMYLIHLNKVLENEKKLDLKATYHKHLLKYYFNLTNLEICEDQIASLHWVFSAIKPTIDKTSGLEKQFFSGKLINLYFGEQNLHVSLLALLNDLEFIDKDKLSAYLFSNKNPINVPAYYRVALRFFIKNRIIKEYFKYLEKLIIEFSNPSVIEVLYLSLMELTTLEGSFISIYNWCYSRMDILSEQNQEPLDLLCTKINNFLNYNNDLFVADPYAKLIKAKLNAHKYALPAKFISDLTKISDTREVTNLEEILNSFISQKSEVYFLEEIEGKDYVMLQHWCENVDVLQESYKLDRREVFGATLSFNWAKKLIKSINPHYHSKVTDE